MKPHVLLGAAIILAVISMAFVGISAYSTGDPLPVLTLFMTGATPVLTAVAVMMKQGVTEKTLKVSEQTDQKVDALLNGSLQGKIARLETRVGHIETMLIDIHTALRGKADEPPEWGAD